MVVALLVPTERYGEKTVAIGGKSFAELALLAKVAGSARRR
jgi:hypothetical protein